jgi:membrane-bound lytic murein transglycosylase B
VALPSAKDLTASPSGLRRSAKARRVAGAAVVAAVALVPVALAAASSTGVVPVASTGPEIVRGPGAGDVLALLRRRLVGPPAVSGRLPESEQISPVLLDALRANPQQVAQDLGPLGPASPGSGATVSGQMGIPSIVFDAYRRAEAMMAAINPNCHVPWSLLAGIGRIESGHARGGQVDAAGNTLGRIMGPALDGRPGFASIAASDGGAWTGDPVWEHAVGPMQFLPSTWKRYALNGKGYGAPDPHNIYDATLSAANYLCANAGDLRDPVQQAIAVWHYNPSDSYVRTVLAWAAAYASGVTPSPTALAAVAPTARPPGRPGERQNAADSGFPPPSRSAPPSNPPRSKPLPSSSPLPVPSDSVTLPRLGDVLGCTAPPAQSAPPVVPSLIALGGLTTGCAITSSSRNERGHEPP